MQAIIKAQGLSKRYGDFTALNKVDLNIYPGQFVGLIGPNGAGKTTLLKALLGLSDYEGKLDVLGLTPLTQRHLLMQKACFIADVAVLPRWMRVDNLINYVDAVHPSFSKEKMQHYLSKTDIKLKHKIKELSKGMITQVHLALVMAVDVPLLVLDEPTLGLDILYRKEFYAHLLEEYFDENRTIIVTTHQAEEIEHLLTHLMFIKSGELILDKPMDQVAEEYSELSISPEHLEAARALKPLHERKMMGRHILLYRNPDKTMLENLGEIHIPSIADLFVALVKETNA